MSALLMVLAGIYGNFSQKDPLIAPEPTPNKKAATDSKLRRQATGSKSIAAIPQCGSGSSRLAAAPRQIQSKWRSLSAHTDIYPLAIRTLPSPRRREMRDPSQSTCHYLG